MPSPIPPAATTRSSTVEDNHDNLGYATEAVTRDARYTRCVDAVAPVTILGETPCAELPDRARARLGAHAGQKNVLVRIVPRRHGTLSNQDANLPRDRVHAALHQGTTWQSAARRPPDPPPP
ncbi:hypothetical protein [Actinophytocola sp. KF-1]